jgi:hypothetical protein
MIIYMYAILYPQIRSQIGLLANFLDVHLWVHPSSKLQVLYTTYVVAWLEGMRPWVMVGLYST